MSLMEIRKKGLMENVLRQYKLLHEYEQMRDLANDPKEAERANREIASITASIQGYIGEFRQISGEKPDTLHDLFPSVADLQAFDGGRSSGASLENSVIRVLFLAASPTDGDLLRLDKEAREIQQKLQQARMREKFEFNIRLAVRPDDFVQALLDVEPQIVHFSGHGSAGGAIFLENDLGESHPVEPDTLAFLFRLVSEQVQCVLLNACHSEAQANAIAEHVPYVIGMNQEISDVGALAFSSGFYQALGAGKSFEQAHDFGVALVRLRGIQEQSTPILITTSK